MKGQEGGNLQIVIFLRYPTKTSFRYAFVAGLLLATHDSPTTRGAKDFQKRLSQRHPVISQVASDAIIALRASEGWLLRSVSGRAFAKLVCSGRSAP